jgi:hypothetical protein
MLSARLRSMRIIAWAGASAAAAPAAAAPSATTHPKLTQPQLLAFGAFAVFVLIAVVAQGGRDSVVDITPKELEEVRKLTLFLIGALLPSDALIRFGRNLLFQTVSDPDPKAQNAPATTYAQWIAFGTYLVVIAMTLLSDQWVSSDEFDQINEVARVLIVALLPSDAGIRFGRALYYRAPTTATPTTEEQLKRI